MYRRFWKAGKLKAVGRLLFLWTELKKLLNDANNVTFLILRTSIFSNHQIKEIMKTQNQFLLEKSALVGAKSFIFLGASLIAFSTFSFASSEPVATVVSSPDFRTTPLCIAISKGETELVKKFVEYGADVNERSNGMTPLMLAARYNHVEIVKYLIANGADVKMKDSKGFTALKHATLSKATDAEAYLKSL